MRWSVRLKKRLAWNHTRSAERFIDKVFLRSMGNTKYQNAYTAFIIGSEYHPDEKVNIVIYRIFHAEVIRAVQRLRLLNRDASSAPDVYVLDNFDVGPEADDCQK